MDADFFLTDREVDELCKPLTQPAAQVRFLRASGLRVIVKPNGRAAVVRSHAEKVLSSPEPGAAPEAPAEAGGNPPQPNVGAFLKVIGRRRKDGSKAHLESA